MSGLQSKQRQNKQLPLKPDKTSQTLVYHTDDISEILTAHDSGTKKVFLNSEQTGNSITQIAFGKLETGESVKTHSHQTMTEYFYFTEGVGDYIIEGQTHSLKKGSFVIITEKTEHSLINTGSEPLCFFYFGIASN